MSKLRIGSVGYLNARPLTDRIDRDRYDLRQDHPAAIASALAAGELDVALVPVAAVLNGEDWRIVPGVCIGAEGVVDSVLLVAETEPEKWTAIALDGESRTSAVLTRLLLADGPLADRVGELEIETVEPGTGASAARGTTAALVIGDAARQLPDRLGVRIDLADAWNAWTGLPFVFAVWAGRPDLDPELVTHLRLAAMGGIASIDEDWSGEDRSYLADRIRYLLDDQALMGLRRFGALAHAAGLLRGEHLQLYGPSLRSIPRLGDVDELLQRAVLGEPLDYDDAMRLEVSAPLTELAAAANLKRASMHQGGTVGWRLGWHLGDPGNVPLAAAAGAHEIHVPEDFDEGFARRLAGPWPSTRFQVGPMVAVLEIGGGESAADRIKAILELRAKRPTAVRVVAAEQNGRPTASQANTATDLLRATALARLLLSVPNLEASSETDGLGLAQASLSMGCNHFGTVFPEEDFDRWPQAVTEIERLIRQAGFEPKMDAPHRRKAKRMELVARS